MSNYVGGRGPHGAKIAFIGEAPGEIEDKEGLPFVGPSGRLLWDIAQEAGLTRNDVYVTNVVKYRPPMNQFHRVSELGINLKDEIEKLKEEILTVDPNVCVVFGGNALEALTGKKKITNWRGSILWWNGRKLIPTIHPSHVLRASTDFAEAEDGETTKGEIFKYWMKYLIQFDLERAVKHSHTREHRPINRIIQPCKSAWDFHSYISRQSDTSQLTVDIEALRGTCMPILIGYGFNANDVMPVPMVSEINGKPTGLHEDSVVQTWQIGAKLLADPKIKKIGHNMKYDEDKINRVGHYLDKLWIDTGMLAHIVYPEFYKKLEFLTSVFTEETYYKDEGKFYDPSNDDFNVLMQYNGKDLVVTREIKDALYKELEELGLVEFFHNFIMPLHRLYLNMERVGFHVNEEVREELVRKYSKWSAENHVQLFELLGYELNVNSPKQVNHTIYEVLKYPLRTGRGRQRNKAGGTGEDVLSQLLANLVRKERDIKIIEGILLGRRINKTLGPQYLFAKKDYDGKMKSTWNINGTENGRTSTYMLKAPLRPEKMGISIQTFTKHGDVGGDIRKFLIPAPGKVIVNIDSEQAEARVCMNLAEDYDSLEMMKTVDIHALTAAWNFGGTWEDHSKKKHGYETPERFIGKTTRHAGHLDIKKGEFARMVTASARKYGISIGLFSEYKANKILETFHAQCPRIRNVFHKGIIEQLEKDRTLFAAAVGNNNIGRRRYFFERWGRELWKEAYAFIPQASVSDNTKCAMLDLSTEYPEIEFLCESHDAMTFQWDENSWEPVARRGKELMERPIKFSKCSLERPDLIIPAEVEIGYNYKELKKVKL